MMTWIEEARRRGTPLLEEGRALFVWEGKMPPLVMGDFAGWAGLEMKPVGRGIWLLAVDLPPDAYCEYVLMHEGRRVADPFNRRVVENGFGQKNHYFYMPKARPAAEVRLRRGTPRGKVRRFRVDTAGSLDTGLRGVSLYRPASDGPLPLLVVYDGREYLKRAHLATILDNMISTGRIRPLAAALIDNHQERRDSEYGCSERTLDFICSKIFPLAQNELPLAQDGEHGVLGASYGGLMALYTALRLPRVFGRVLAQSGAYRLRGLEFPVWKMDGNERQRVWMDVGSMEYLLACNREMQAYLAGAGCEVSYHEYQGGHNYTVWRDDLPRALTWLYGAREETCG